MNKCYGFIEPVSSPQHLAIFFHEQILITIYVANTLLGAGDKGHYILGEGKITDSINQGKHLGGLDKVVKAYVAQKSLGYRERERE